MFRLSSVFNEGKDLSQFRHTVFLLIFSICGNAHALDPESRSVSRASGGNQIACPSRDFSEFIEAFSESNEMQMTFTRYPLQQLRLDLSAKPEPKPVVRELRRDQVSFPVIPNKAERKKKSLVLRIDENKSTHVKLTLVKPDTDYQVEYFFGLNSCWRLERIEDWSL